MRIALITMGTPGDVRPFVALGGALVAAGHQARLATFEVYRDLALGHGLEFHALPGAVEALLSSGSGQSLLGAGGSPLRNLRHYSRLAGELLDGFVTGSERASQDADLIIASAPGLLAGGLHAAESLGIPFAGASLQPLHATADFASVLFPPWPSGRVPGRSIYNRLSHVALPQLAWQLARRRLDRARRRQLGLGALPRRFPVRLLREGQLWLYGYSPALLPRPRDWPRDVHVTGYWFLEDPAEWTPPSELVDFLTAGPPPVYVGFGSAGHLRAAESVEISLEALRLSGQRGVVRVPDQRETVSVLRDDAIGVGDVPHDWLFPRVSTVVHHVGLGTVETTLRARRPAVAVPHYMDEPFWARRLARLGVSPGPVSRDRLTPSRLARRIGQATSDRGMQERVDRLGELVAAEDGARRAVSVIERHAGLA